LLRSFQLEDLAHAARFSYFARSINGPLHFAVQVALYDHELDLVRLSEYIEFTIVRHWSSFHVKLRNCTVL
jgi:hypothetical protein